MSSNGQNCSILSQKVPKFELYKHNDELFNIYYGIFLPILTDYEIKKKGGMKLKKNLNFELLPILTDYEIKKKGG